VREDGGGFAKMIGSFEAIRLGKDLALVCGPGYRKYGTRDQQREQVERRAGSNCFSSFCSSLSETAEAVIRGLEVPTPQLKPGVNESY
jgi:hypothetical protein